jgi:beta-glucosidase
MSDWGGVPSLDAALAGLDQQSAAMLDPAIFFDKKLLAAAASDPAYAVRLDDMNKRIVTAIYATGLDAHPVKPGGTIDFKANAAVAEEVARQGIVLLKNSDGVLPLAKTAKHIAVIGGYADTGVLSGAGSSQVHGKGGPAAVRPLGGSGILAQLFSQQYHGSAPLAAIRARVPKTRVNFRDGRYIADAVTQARQADVAIVFATQWMTEGLDAPDLSLPDGQDALIAAVAEANPRTIVVLETGGPVAMPWLSKVAAVVEAWYPGARGGEAIAAVLFGEVNPSGHLPVTFPKAIADLPRAEIAGAETLDPSFSGAPPSADTQLLTDYRIEGSDLGYRWNARQGNAALFPFGHGLSYTSFAHQGLKTDGRTASFTVRNTGDRAGADVAQLYLLDRNGAPKQRLIGFQRVELAPDEARRVTLKIDPRLLADWKDGGWEIAAGRYSFGLGEDAEKIGERITVRLDARRWTD